MRLRTYAHFLWHALRLRWSRTYRVPLTVNIQLLVRCCNRCAYCGQDHADPTELSLDVVLGVFEEAWDLGTRRVHLTGGEPLLRDDLADIVRAARDRGFFVSVSTNGARARRQLEALRMFDRVMLSFDGPPEVREQLSGPGSAEAADEAVAVFGEHGIPFWTTTVLTRASIPHVEWIVDHARRHGSRANFVLLHTCEGEGLRIHPRPDEVIDLRPSDQEYRRVIARLIELKRSGAPIGSSMPYLEEWLEWPDYGQLVSTSPSRRYKRCVALRAGCELYADGKLYACDFAFGHTGGVSVLDGGFAEAFKKLPVKTDCRSCVASCWLESNLIFSLNPRTVWNWIRHV